MGLLLATERFAGTWKQVLASKYYIALHCLAVCFCGLVYIGRVSFSLLQTLSFNDAVLSSDCCNVEWKCRRVLVFLRGCFQRHFEYVASTQTADTTHKKLARSTAHSNTVLQTQLLRSYDLCHRYLLFMYFISLSLFRRGAIILYCVTCYRVIDC